MTHLMGIYWPQKCFSKKKTCYCKTNSSLAALINRNLICMLCRTENTVQNKLYLLIVLYFFNFNAM